MDAGVQNESLLVKNQFIHVLKDFSQYLLQQKQTGNIFFKISKESETKVNNWGRNWDLRDGAQENFFFQGPENAKVFILDSSTGFFKDKSGELLIKILAAMKLTTDSVFICNAGDPESVNAKIKIISPKVIITLGEKAGQSLLKIQRPLEKFQGRFREYNGIKVMPTFHPSLLLKKPEFKRQVWEDMQQVMEYAGTRHGS
jgi:DNA polymerase